MNKENTMSKSVSGYSWTFFGTSRFSVIVLDKLKEKGFIPTLIVTVEDKPKGRKMILTPPETKIWATKEGVPYLQLKTLKKPESEEAIRNQLKEGCEVFVVASYGKIIPQNILDIPRHHCLNVHPSLLPKLRGPSPIKSAILTLNETGVSIIRLDAEMDHGPILAQKKVVMEEWPPYEENLEKILGEVGGEMLSELLPLWINSKIKEQEQDHSLATICQKIEKSDGQINLEDNPEINLRKIRAYHTWPTTYFFLTENNIKKRIVVKKAHIENGKLVLDRIIPEGKKEMDYKDFIRNKKDKLRTI